MEIISIAITLFIVSNPIGSSPTILSLVKDFPFKEQKRILLREALFSLLIAIFFQFLGEIFLNMLHVKDYTVTICGGLLLFIVAVQMIFSYDKRKSTTVQTKEPYLVPIATPLLSGPGLLTIIMLYSHQQTQLKLFAAILIAWVGVIGVVVSAPYIQKILGKRGLMALEQLMGMILSMIAMDMIVRGVSLFAKAVQHST